MKALKIIGVIICGALALTGFLTSSDDSTGLTMGILFTIPTAVLVFFLTKPRAKGSRTDRGVKTHKDILQENGFTVSKEIQTTPGIFKTWFLVDDVNKKFAIAFESTPSDTKIYSYLDIIDFELNEDGNSIAQGKGFATAVGAATFGLAGAMVCAAGKRKTKGTCTTLDIRIMLNDLQSPQAVVSFIHREIKKDSPAYTAQLEVAKEVMATLSYIQNQADKTADRE